MGLAGGDHGPKAALRLKYPNAWETAQTVEEVSNKTLSCPKEVVAVIDGNVAAMAVPSEIATLEDMTSFLYTQFCRHLEAALNVVVVLDDPATLTKAKRAEQQRRDATRKKPVPTSEDLAPRFVNDDYLVSQLRDKEDVRLLIGNRKTRQRILDAIFAGLFKKLERKLLGRLCTAPPASFSVVGCDSRGGERPVGERRRADVLSTDDMLQEALEASVTAGEGDLKLTQTVDVAIADRERKNSPLASFKTVHVFTIDTDSILIELAAEARRVEEEKLVNTFVCFKERAPKRDADDQDRPRFTLLDVSGLLEFVCEDLFGLSFDKIAPTLVRPAVALFTMAQAAQGCDFASLKGLRTIELIDACRVVCSEEYQYLSTLPCIWRGSEEDLLLAEPALRRVLSLCGSQIETVSRRKVHASALKAPPPAEVLKVLWTVRYWMGEEIKSVERWGFGAPTASPDMVLVE